MSRILPLPADAISQIRSSKNITSLQDVVLALLENSLDSGATKVEVSIDLPRGSCTVEDDGLGIPAAEFEDGGGLGKMYHTSKRLPDFDRKHDLHGWNGTYLASQASLSLLSITSRQAGCQTSSTLTMHQGKVISRRVSEPTSNLTEHSTQVTVRDLFGNMPVRVKQRALASENVNDDDKAWHKLKHGIAALLLAWPRPCSVRLADANRSNRKVHLAGSHPSVSAALTKSGLRQLDSGKQSTYGIREALPVLFQTGLAPPESRANWIPVSASAVEVTVKGLISLDPAPTKQCQFVSLGIHVVGHGGVAGDVYDAINKVFVNSSFGAAEELEDVDGEEKDRRKRDRRFKGDGYTQKQLQERKGVDRWPMFVLQVRFRDQKRLPARDDNLSDATLKSVVQVLEATVTQWLAAHHFRPRKKRARKRNGEPLRPESALNGGTSSAAGSSCVGHSAPGTSTPTLKCTASALSATDSKRRRVGDVSGRPHSMDQPIASRLGASASPFGQWSRIKSGKQSDGRKTATAPEGQTGSLPHPAPPTKSCAFTLPPLEAGALSDARQRHAQLHPAMTTTPAVRTGPEPPTISSEDFGSVDDEEMAAVAVEAEAHLVDQEADPQRDGASADQLVDWVDPKTKQRYRVNTRTGVVLPARPKTANLLKTIFEHASGPSRQSATTNTTVSSKGMPLSLAKRATPSRPNTAGMREAATQWLPGFLQDWNNPVFAHQDEEHIPVALPDGPGLEAGETSKHGYGHHHQPDNVDGLDGKGTARITKEELREAKVIRQVDRKFILCTTTTDSGNGEGRVGLVLIDQHAVSERVILEDLLADLCSPPNSVTPGIEPSGVKTTPLDRPARFQISEKEVQLSESQKQHFARWGILYHLEQREVAVSASQDVWSVRKQEHILTVTHLPPTIAQRCTLVPRILIEMLRSELYSATTSLSHPPPPLASNADSPDGQAQHTWLKHIGSCPKGILDLLNSRACRSAIMFNDELSVEQCEGLVERLGRCAFPFVCAHGRVSMVPLADLGGWAEGGEDGGLGVDACGFDGGAESTESFSAAFGRWADRDRSSAGNEEFET